MPAFTQDQLRHTTLAATLIMQGSSEIHLVIARWGTPYCLHIDIDGRGVEIVNMDENPELFDLYDFNRQTWRDDEVDLFVGGLLDSYQENAAIA